MVPDTGIALRAFQTCWDHIFVYCTFYSSNMQHVYVLMHLVRVVNLQATCHCFIL